MGIYNGPEGDPERPYWVLNYEEECERKRQAWMQAHPDWKPPWTPHAPRYAVLKLFEQQHPNAVPSWLRPELQRHENHNSKIAAEWIIYAPTKHRGIDKMGARLPLTTLQASHTIEWTLEEFAPLMQHIQQYLESVDLHGKYCLGHKPWLRDGT